MYSFKFCYKDGSYKIGGGKGKTPESLVNDFDGLIDWDLYDKIIEEKLSTKEILKIAFDCYRKYYKNYNRIEIINIDTLEVVDAIEIEEK